MFFTVEDLENVPSETNLFILVRIKDIRNQGVLNHLFSICDCCVFFFTMSFSLLCSISATLLLVLFAEESREICTNSNDDNQY